MNIILEKDSLGKVEVPRDALYGAKTVRAMKNFNITNRLINPLMIHIMGMVKKSSAEANFKCGILDVRKRIYIIKACDEVISGKLDSEFLTDPIQGGAGTSFNMNMNEVIANRAAQIAGKPIGIYDYIHPNDHVNMSQSTNDVFPTAGRITSLYLVNELLEELLLLQEAFLIKSKEFDDVIKPGRTHLQDAVPIRMGQEFHAYATSLLRDINRIKNAFSVLKSINIGATAIGTSLNADKNYIKHFLSSIKEQTGLELVSMDDLIDGTRNVDVFVYASSSLKTLAINLSKICNDIRLMTSGPKTGFGEIILPARQPGSSIMPGKVNPVIPEVVNQVCFQVEGNDLTIGRAAEAGQLELNVFEPVLFHNLFESLEILTNACFSLRKYAILNMRSNKEHCMDLVDQSLCTITVLAPHIGYDKASEIAKKSLLENKTIECIMKEQNLLSKEQLQSLLDAYSMT